MSRIPALRTHFLLSQGWEPVEERATKTSPPITMWRDPHVTVNKNGEDERSVLWPHEAEYRADRRLQTVRSVMEG